MCAQAKTVTAEEAAKLLHISKRKCAWMLQNGHIPCIDTGKTLYHTPQGRAQVREEHRLDRVPADVLLGQGEPKKAQFDRRTMRGIHVPPPRQMAHKAEHADRTRRIGATCPRRTNEADPGMART